MRIAIAEFNQESNGFTPNTSDLAHFEAGYVLRGDQIPAQLAGTNRELAGAIAAISRAGAELVPIFAAHATPRGRVQRSAVDALTGELLERLRSALPVDGVVVATHGAMTAEGDDDPEGTLLTQVREVVGPNVPVAVTCDMHAHMTEKLCAAVDVLVGYQTYPHDDSFQTGERAAELIIRTIRGEIHPVVSLAKVGMILPGSTQLTATGPFSLLWYEANELVRKGEAIWVSLFAVHSKVDVPGEGWAAVVVTEQQPERGRQLAEELCRKAWSMRREFDLEMLPPREAVERALAVDRGPVVILDCGEVPGTGAAGDSTHMLRALLEVGVTETCLLSIVDPEAVAACHAAGPGKTVRLLLGHKMDPQWGKPMAVEGYVKSLADGRFTHTGGLLGGSTVSVGPSAVLHIGAIQILLTCKAFYEYDDVHFRSHGMEASRARIVVVKMLINYQLTMKSMARHMLVADTPGPGTAKFESLPWKGIQRPIWPLDREAEPVFWSWAPDWQ